MSVISTRARLLAMAVALCIATSAGAVLALVDTRTSDEKAKAWAEAPGTDLPDTLDEMSSYPTAYRRAAFKKVSPQTRYDLWQANLSQIASGQLTSEQRALVLEFKKALRPEFYHDASSHDDVKEALIKPICKRIAALFPGEQGRMFGSLGPVQRSSDSEFVRLVRNAKALLPAYIVNANASKLHDCNCVGDTHCLEDCDTWEYCGNSDGCSQGGWCGCLQVWDCDALCTPTPAQ